MSVTDPPTLVLISGPEEILAEQAVASIVMPIREHRRPSLRARSSSSRGSP